MIDTTVLILLIVNIGYASLQSCLFLPNVNLHGGTMDEFKTNNIKECCVACSSNTCCIAYTYDTEIKRCYLKSAIGYSSENTLTTSGLKPNAYFGKGVKLRNVKIQGDQPIRIDLGDHEECRQYCTAYQVFTWTPSTDESVQRTGDCSCTMRIKSLKYDYGCISEINPTPA